MRPLAPLVLLIAASLALTACGPNLPKGVNEDALAQAVDKAVGDDFTCVILAEPGTGKTVWKAGLGHACRVQYPSCLTKTVIDDEQFAREAAKTGAPPLRVGCDSVSWVSGRTPKSGLVYGAVMWGKRALPGIEIARRLDGVFADSGL